MKKVLILGSTGSVGTQTLDVIRSHPERLQVVGLVANRNVQLLNQQLAEFHPPYCAIADASLTSQVDAGSACKVFSGPQGVLELCHACGADIVVSAIVGLAGLEATMACIENEMTIALANKESLVGGGKLVMNAAKKHGVDILPVDSEHSAVYQCIQNQANHNSIRTLYLTASGGPFYDYPADQMEEITVAQALNHPTWSMGSKITIDSATMMNKGFEIIEAKWLFDLSPDQIQVAVHRKSIVHSMVEFDDYSILAQLSKPSMTLPIQYALLYPERLPCPTPPLNIFEMGNLSFLPPDPVKFPCLDIAYRSIRDGNGRGLIINAANEVAVEAFLNEQIKFTDIYQTIEKAYVTMNDANEDSLADMLALDQETRAFCREYLNQRSCNV